jgi:queuine tRNA-ribosyltransferase
MPRLNFQLEKTATGSRARAARFKTLHNEVLTPLFMPVGTHATVRGQQFGDLLDSGSQILLANTYHLLLRPGVEVFNKMGGIHGFTKWPKSFLTDSGGFQIFAMPNDRKMSEEGARFLSYVDGKHILLTPELSIQTQLSIGSDIMMVLDQCVPSTVDKAEARAAMELSNRWALRSLAARGESLQSIFAIVQGACYQKLRKESAEFLTQHPFDGFALGGLAVGETKQEREDTTEFAAALLPTDLPRYLMGVGTPIDLLEAVHRGMDMFDCIIPTAHAEQGVAYTWKGKVLLRRGVYKMSEEPIDANCKCPACKTYSRAYLYHLIKTGEPLGRQLIGAHNIQFYHDLMSSMRKHILADTFLPFYTETREHLVASDGEYPIKAPRVRLDPRPMELGDYEIQVLGGVSRLRHKSSGEVMHPQITPQQEAEELYVAQSRFTQRIQEQEDLVLWDVGMGACSNVMAAIQAYEKLAAEGKKLARLHVVSFENDLDSLKLAMQHLERFTHLRHGGPASILARGEWISKKVPIEWKLMQGDFLELLEEAPAPDIIFYDPYSTKTCRDCWTVETLQRIFDHSADRQGPGTFATEFFTYSTSTAVRASFLAAGFHVAQGQSTGHKLQTTIALTEGALPWRTESLLGQDWFNTWHRSDSAYPLTLSGEQEPEMLERVRNHPQFAGMKPQPARKANEKVKALQ